MLRGICDRQKGDDILFEKALTAGKPPAHELAYKWNDLFSSPQTTARNGFTLAEGATVVINASGLSADSAATTF